MSVGSVFTNSVQPFSKAWLLPVARISGVVCLIGSLSTQRLLEAAPDAYGWRIETFGSAQAFLASSCYPGPSCLVLDITLPCLKGIALRRRLCTGRAHMPIILTAGNGEVLMTVLPMKLGTFDLVPVGSEEEGLQGATRTAIEYSRRALCYEQGIAALRGRYALLSARERQVLSLVAAGLLNKEVGCELGISEITVKAHRGNVMRKMKAQSLAQLVKMAASLELEIEPWKANRPEAA